jgi:hypothetical protein
MDDTTAKPATLEIETIALSDIAIPPERMRSLREDIVDALVESMGNLGLLQPIVVQPCNGRFVLLAGRHRFEAARRLGWESVRCTILRDNDTEQVELAEIDENLIRAELSPAERALHIRRRKAIYESLHPETRHGGDRKSKSSCQNGDSKRFTKETAKKTRTSERKVQRDVTRGKKVVVLNQIAGTSLDTSTELDALAKLSPEEQRKLAECATLGKKVSAKAVVELPLTDATQGPAQPDCPTPEQRWQCRLKDKADDAISTEASWSREFGEWRTFAVSSRILELAQGAAAAWSKIADEISERATPRQAKTTAKPMLTP